MQEQTTYDAIVVGSGITGGWAAKELCEKGLKVLLLERGRNLEHPNYPTATKDPWEFPHRLHLSEEDKKIHYVQARHYSLREDNKHFYINDQQNTYDETKRFDWIRGDTVGGRSLLWARACYRWSDFDFEANLRDGIAIDWPIRYKEIAPWYNYVERFIGVSGSSENLPVLPDGIFQPAFEMNEVEKFFKTQIEKTYSDRKVIMGRTANLTKPVKGRGHCMARDLCHRGCPYGAYFSTNASTFPAAYATGNLTVRPHSLVTKVIYDEQKQKATGVEIIDTQSRQTTVFNARLIFLNAATVATCAILLNSTSSRFPNGLGNGSDQVGRNLMDHHKGLSASAKVDGFEDSYYYGRRPTSLYIPRFKNTIKKEPGFLRGYQLGASASRGHSGSINGIGDEFKDALTEPSGWSISLWGEGETLPYADNRIILNHNKPDQWGQPTITVDCEFKENEKAMNKDIGETAQEMLERLGLKKISISNTISFPGNANHEMGTARMGRNPKTSVLNNFNQMHEVKNIFITDGSCMASSSCVNPSLTYMALTARACDYAIKEMNRLNI
jgi:choline dehydrogenase-like flavoprotein